MNYVDYQILAVLILSALFGFKNGFLKTAVSLLGMILIIVISFYLKNPLATTLYENLPFFSLKGYTVLNILVYEGIAFIIVFSILLIVFKIIVKLTNILDKALSFVLFMGIPSKILGTILGFIEGIVLVFIVFFVFLQIDFKTDHIQQSKYGHKIMTGVPVLSNVVNEAYTEMKEIYDLNDKHETKGEYNKAAFEMMLDKKILSVESARKLIEKKKLTIENAEDIISKYEMGK